MEENACIYFSASRRAFGNDLMRKLYYSFLIALPAVIIMTLLGIWGIKELPRLQKAEPRRIGMIYRSYAEELKDAKGDYEGPRKKGWRQRGKIEGRGWGYIAQGDTCEVWLQKETGVFISKTVPAETENDYYLLGGIIFGVVISFLSFFTWLAIFGFLKYWQNRDDFLAAVTHDLTTPLIAMRMFIGKNDQEALRLVEVMLRMVKNFKETLSRGVGRRIPETEKFNLIDAYNEAYKLYKLDFEDAMEGGILRKNQINTLIVNADKMMTTQVIWNLLGNELKYASAWGRVEVDFRLEGGKAILELSDEGPGMTRYQKFRAFDRYYRAKSMRQSGKGGFGIGLCTARDYARAMNGDVRVYDNSPKGCVFRLYLPV